MKWSTPRIVEIAVGLEINAYACAGGTKRSAAKARDLDLARPRRQLVS